MGYKTPNRIPREHDEVYIKYGDFTFTNPLSVGVSVEPVFDGLGKLLLYYRYTITVRDVISYDGEGNVGTNMDSSFDEIVARLSYCGNRLQINGVGCGLIDVGPGATSYDVEFGPRPRVVNWRPVGSSRTIEITWQVVAAVPRCELVNSLRGLAPISLYYSTSFSIDNAGMTTRTLSGYWEVWKSRKTVNVNPVKGNVVVDDNAITVRALDVIKAVAFPLLPRFRRQSHNFTESADGSRCDFVIVDVEIESISPHPTGICDINTEYVLGASAANKHGFANWMLGVSTTLRPRLNIKDKAYPYKTFIAIIRSLFAKQIKKELRAKHDNSWPFLVLEEFSHSWRPHGNLYSFEAKFSISLTPFGLFADGSKGDIEGGPVGLWKSVDINQWETCLEDNAALFANYGVSSLLVASKPTKLVNACRASRSLIGEVFVEKLHADMNRKEPDNPKDAEGKVEGIGVLDDSPSVKSYVRLDVDVHIIEDTGVSVIKKLPKELESEFRTDDKGNPVSSNPGSLNEYFDVHNEDKTMNRAVNEMPKRETSDYEIHREDPGKDLLAKTGNPKVRVAILTTAERVGEPIPQPKYGTLGGERPVLVESRSENRMSRTTYEGLTVHELRHLALLEFERAPKKVPPMNWTTNLLGCHKRPDAERCIENKKLFE